MAVFGVFASPRLCRQLIGRRSLPHWRRPLRRVPPGSPERRPVTRRLSFGVPQVRLPERVQLQLGNLLKAPKDAPGWSRDPRALRFTKLPDSVLARFQAFSNLSK